jgi:hypothetical protein
VLLPPQSVHRLSFQVDAESFSVPVRVSHVDPQISAGGERTYLIGVQFLSAQPPLLALIDTWLVAKNGEVAGA